MVVSETDNFPTDLYIAEGVVADRDASLALVPATSSDARFDAIVSALGPTTAVLMLTHVNYRTGAMHDMAALTKAAHDAGALVVWDLAHSAGAVPVDLHAADADFAIGCGYKYLNGGPGAPAFVWAHPRHVDRLSSSDVRQPLSGWMGHASPFTFTERYAPADGVARFLCGTPPMLSMTALECGVASLMQDDGSRPDAGAAREVDRADRPVHRAASRRCAATRSRSSRRAIPRSAAARCRSTRAGRSPAAATRRCRR